MTDKPQRLIEAEAKIRAAFDAHDAKVRALTERIANGEAHMAAHPDDLRGESLLSALRTKLEKLQSTWLGVGEADGEMQRALAEYTQIHEECEGWRWELDEQTHETMDARMGTVGGAK